MVLYVISDSRKGGYMPETTANTPKDVRYEMSAVMTNVPCTVLPAPKIATISALNTILKNSGGLLCTSRL